MLDDLALYEEVMLLALRDREGTIAAGATFHFAIGGAVLCELLLRDRIALRGDKKPKVAVKDPTPLGDDLIDEWLSKIHEAGKERTMQDWVSRVAHTKHLKERVATGLCEKRILRASQDKVLHMFTRKIYPELDPKPEHKILRKIEGAIFEPAGDVDPHTAILVGLCHHASILTTLFEKDRMKRAKPRIEEITNGTHCTAATKEAIEAMQITMIVIAAVVVPTITT